MNIDYYRQKYPNKFNRKKEEPKKKKHKVLGIPYKNHYELYDINEDGEKVYWGTRKIKTYFRDNNYPNLLKEIEDYQQKQKNMYFNYINKMS